MGNSYHSAEGTLSLPGTFSMLVLLQNIQSHCKALSDVTCLVLQLEENKQIKPFMSLNVDCQLSVTDTHATIIFPFILLVHFFFFSIHLFQYQNNCLWEENCYI